MGEGIYRKLIQTVLFCQQNLKKTKIFLNILVYQIVFMV